MKKLAIDKFQDGMWLRLGVRDYDVRVLSLVLGIKTKTVLGSFPSEIDAIHAAKTLKEKNHG